MTDQSWPPSGPTNVLSTIPSYLYEEYADDDDLQAFVAAFNTLAQSYGPTWLNLVNLPIYTGLAGLLLDWVGAGLYGMPRPTLYSPYTLIAGPYNTVPYNSIPYNFSGFYQAGNVVSSQGIGQFAIGISPIGGRIVPVPEPSGQATNDDTYQRILTWHFYKGDGWYFNIRWLKRRVMRFLFGDSGTDPGVSQTYRISVSFGPDHQVNIRILTGIRTVTGGAIYGQMAYNAQPYNALTSIFEALPAVPEAPVFVQAMQSGVLSMPFQFSNVTVLYGA